MESYSITLRIWSTCNGVFQVVELFCSRKGITTWTRILYQVHNLSDFVEFCELVSNLESAWCLKLRLHAVFVRDIRDLLHLNLSNSYRYDLIPRLMGRLIEVRINHQSLIISHDFIDLSMFAKVEALQLFNCNVISSSFSSCQKLKELLFSQHWEVLN